MKKNNIALFIIVILACILRFWRLGEIPEGFHADEAAFGYNAYSILKTGKDEYGIPHPLILKSFGDNKGALYAYGTIPFVHFFGLTQWSVRAPSAVVGVLFVIIVYLLTYTITKQYAFAFIAALFSSISPVSVLLSRIQSDPLVSVAFIYMGIYCFLRWVENKRWFWGISAFIQWFIAIYTYQTFRIFLLFFIPFLFVYVKKRLSKDQIVLSLGFYGIFCFVCLMGFISNGSRFDQVSMFGRADIMLPLEEHIREDGIQKIPIFLSRAYHNKPLEHLRYFLSSCAKYVSFEFLFYEATQPLRERIPNTGVLFIVELPFLLIGLYLIFRKRYVWRILILLWMVIGIGSVSLAVDESPNIHRFLIIIYPFYLLSTVGIHKIYEEIKKRYKGHTGVFILGFIFSLNVLYFFHQLFIHQPTNKPYYRGFAYKQLVEKLTIYDPLYNKIIFSKGNSSPYIYLLFFTEFNPSRYQAFGSPRDLDNSGFDKYLFVPEDCPYNSNKFDIWKTNKEGKTLYVNKGGCNKNKAHIVDIIYWRDGQEAFQLAEYIPGESDLP